MATTINMTFNDAAGKTWTFEKLKSACVFFNKEVVFWEKQLELVNDIERQNCHKYLKSHDHLKYITDFLNDLLNDDAMEQVDVDRKMNAIQRSHIRNLPDIWLWSGQPFVSAFIESQVKHDLDTANTFIDFIIDRSVGRLNDASEFTGTMLAYEFINQNSDINKRSKSEKISLDNLRDTLDKSTSELVDNIEKIKHDFLIWDDDNKQETLVTAQLQTQENQTQQAGFKSTFDNDMSEAANRILALESTYQEKLRLEKPATYWKEASKEYKRQGYWWALLMVLFLSLGIYFFSDFFTTWLKGKETAVQLNTIQGVVIFGTVLALYAFLIKSLSRLAFSSFHLMRDAQEREQLTYLYLALVNDKKIDETSRDIVLQALFARSETGLLAKDHGPTMPGIADLLKTHRG